MVLGFGQKIKRTQNLAVMAATGKAYRQRFHLALGSWDLRNIQTVPFYVIGRSGSGVRVHLKPAPEGTGLHGPTAGAGCPAIMRKILPMVGIKDCIVRVQGKPKLILNIICAVHDAFTDLDSNHLI